MKNNKTTLYGVLTIISTLVNAIMQYVSTGSFDVTSTVTGLTAGYGLIMAADAKPKLTP